MLDLRRRQFITLLGGAAVAWPVVGRTQQRTAVPQIGILDPGLPQHFEAFRRGMDDLGYVESRSVSYIYRSAAGRAESVPRLASELVALKPDAIVTASALPVRAVKEATSTIPIVFATLADAITAGAVNNLAHPGANVTGFSFLNTELSAKRLELLVEALPNIRRVAVLRDLNTPREWAEATEEAGHRLGLTLQLLEVAGPETYESAFEAAVTARADALDILASAFFNSHKARLVELAAKYRLPTMYEHDDFVRTGGLIAYGPNIPDLFRRTAVYVDRILKGAKPGDLPVEQPTRFTLIINVKTVNALGLILPPTLLARADEVIE
jgi:putative tryptophan/tyrosine transport system substrate-binding protein